MTGIRTFSLIMTSLILLMHAEPTKAQNSVVKVAVLDYPPFVIVEDDGYVTGSNPEIMRAVFGHLGFSVEFHAVPFTRSIRLTENGTYDVIGAIDAHSDAMVELSKDPLANQIGAFFVRASDDWRYAGIPSLASRRVLYVKGYDYSALDLSYQEYVETSSNVKKVTASGDHLDTIIRLINGNRADVTLEDVTVMNYTLNATGKTGILKEAGRLEGRVGLHIGFAPNERGEKLRQLFDATFTNLLEQGKINSILDEFGIERIGQGLTD